MADPLRVRLNGDGSRSRAVDYASQSRKAAWWRPFCGVDDTDQANDTLRRDWRNAKPRPAKPISIMAQVAGSGMEETVTLSRTLPI